MIYWEVLVKSVGVGGHQIEEEHNLSSTNRWPNRGGQQDSDPVAQGLLQQASQALG